ncbi:MAG: hypothetical protein CM1200mP26_09970 [Acidimicrobiales bacterium]|nr:MAG: hypothetical protein CM1200mP26_09970 [Acidimicrobiales bacterium]
MQRDLSAYGELAAVVVVRNGWVIEASCASDSVDGGLYVGPVVARPMERRCSGPFRKSPLICSVT